MRPKGWRNDPRWVEHYRALDKERLEREVIRLEFESQQRMHVLQTLEVFKAPGKHMDGGYAEKIN